MRNHCGMVLVLAGASACRSAASPPPAEAAAPHADADAPEGPEASAAFDLRDAASAVSVPAASAVDAPDGCQVEQMSRPFRELPCFRFDDMPRPLGFTKDGRALGYCVVPGDLGNVTDCGLLNLASDNLRTFTWSWSPASPNDGEAEQKKRDAQVDHFLTSNGLTPPPAGRTLHGPFPFDDLSFALKVEPNPRTGAILVSIGAHATGEPAVYPLSLVVGPHPLWKAFPSTMSNEEKQLNAPMGEPQVWIDVRPDGREIGVIAFAGGAMFHEEARAAHAATRRFVAQVYREEARLRAASGDGARADELTKKAQAAEAGATP